MKYVKLDKLCDITMGQSPDSSSYNDKGIGLPFFQGKSEFGKIYPTAKMYCTEPKKTAQPLDILMSVRAPVGDVNISNIDCCIGRGLCSIRCKNNINYKYIYYYLRTQKKVLESQSTGSTFKAINKSIVSELEIPLQDLDAQHKIVEILDKSQELIDKRKEQIELLDELIQSKFLEMFGNPITNPKRWEKDKLSNKCNIITGNTPSRKVTNYYGNYIEWIKSDNISNSNVYLSKAKEYLSEEGAKVGRIIEKNNILMTCIAGSKKCIGNVAINNRDVAFNQQINGIEVLKNNVYFMFHQFLLSQDYIQSTINMSLKGILSKGQLSELEFIFPPITLQEEFANFVKKVNDIKMVLNKSLEQLNDNFDSLMQKSFKGELF